MHLRNIKETEHFQFTNACQLREWLNLFRTTDLHAVNLYDSHDNDYLTLHYETEVLSDGSEVNNIRIA